MVFFSLLKIPINQAELVKAASVKRSVFRSVYEEMKRNVPESIGKVCLLLYCVKGSL